MLKKEAKEDNLWLPYFQSIKKVCPWSLKAYMSEKILILNTNENCIKTWGSIFTKSKYEAFVYKFPEASVTWLTDKCDQLNASQNASEWLWSCPTEGGDSTPVAVLIQQDREQLECLRDKIGYEDEKAQ